MNHSIVLKTFACWFSEDEGVNNTGSL